MGVKVIVSDGTRAVGVRVRGEDHLDFGTASARLERAGLRAKGNIRFDLIAGRQRPRIRRRRGYGRRTGGGAVTVIFGLGDISLCWALSLWHIARAQAEKFKRSNSPKYRYQTWRSRWCGKWCGLGSGDADYADFPYRKSGEPQKRVCC